MAPAAKNHTLMGFEIDLRSIAGIRKDGTSRWISMFPPSYADRACIRNATRRALVLRGVPPAETAAAATTTTVAAITAPPDPPAEPAPGPASASIAAQTDMTYCGHECVKHKRAAGAFSLSQKCELDENGAAKKAEKDESKAKAKENRDGGSKGGEKKGKHKETKKGKDKDKASPPKDDSGSEGDSDDSNGDSGDEIVTKKPSAKQTGTSSHKKKGKGKEKQAEAKEPEAHATWSPFTNPWLACHITTNHGQNWIDQKDARERSARLAHEAIEAAKRADEDSAARWVKEQELLAQQNALHWLRMKYRPSYEEPESAIPYAPPSIFPYHESDNIPPHHMYKNSDQKQKHVSFADPLRQSSSAPILPSPPWRTGMPPPGPEPVVVYNENGRMYTSDGHEVVIISKQGVKPAGDSRAQNLGYQHANVYRSPLQETNGNSSHRPQRPHAANNWYGPPQNHQARKQKASRPASTAGRPPNSNPHSTQDGNDWSSANQNADSAQQRQNNQAWASGALGGDGSGNADWNTGNGDNGSTHSNGWGGIPAGEEQNQDQYPEWSGNENQSQPGAWPNDDDNANADSVWPDPAESSNPHDNPYIPQDSAPNSGGHNSPRNTGRGGNRNNSGKQNPHNHHQHQHMGGNGNGNGNDTSGWVTNDNQQNDNENIVW